MTREEYEAEKRAIEEEMREAADDRTEAQNRLTRLHGEMRALKLQYMHERAAVQRHMDRD
jgi:hypothetical protein